MSYLTNGYSKLIRYGDFVEIFRYERPIVHSGRKKKPVQEPLGMSSDSILREAIVVEEQQKKARRKSNIRHAVLAFKRLTLANLRVGNEPVLASLTYAGDTQEIGQGHQDFNAFARNLRSRFGKQVQYICVAEWQKRGALHFHALIWGLPHGVAASERHTRVVASLWGQGFVDLRKTDGHPKIASYLSKYMAKAFADPRLAGKKAYVASRGIKRPVVDRNPIMLMYHQRGLIDLPDLSTAELLQEKWYMTQWLGQAYYQRLKIN